MTAQLSDPNDYDGCDLTFIRQCDQKTPDVEIARQRGSVIFYPPYYPHHVTPTLRGQRMAVIAWFTGEEWR